ncbi:MAG: helicase [Betaproteobacteria bacterium]|nr:helicase [Betaproteobacteria bacterium]
MNSFQQARGLLVTDLRRYFIGPIAEADELISEAAWDRYHVAMLAPAGTAVESEEDDQDDTTDAGGGTDGGAGDGILALANVQRQAAVGMTFHVNRGENVSATVSYANYVQELVSEGRFQWRRHPRTLGPFTVPTTGSADGTRIQKIVAEDGLDVFAATRLTGNAAMVTLSVVNRRVEPKREARREPGTPRFDCSVYQVEMSVVSPSGLAVFARPPGIIADDEYVVHEVLYRDVRQFAVGHGCAVDWLLPADRTDRALEIHLDWIPSAEVLKASSDVAGIPAGSRMLRLDFLSNVANRAAICNDLRKISETYETWIGTLEAKRNSIVGGFDSRLAHRVTQAIDGNIAACHRIAKRIRAGIELLKARDVVFQAFALGNAAMAETMRRSRPDKEPEWRPFQIAFILVSLESIVDESHEDRRLMDLIWFPTGGGKTEAYLGLVALVLFHRRLTGATKEFSSGTAVLTRYTLRLLTLQQFERSTRLIMACEAIRRRNPDLYGDIEFSIGLFVGNSATPGDLDTAAEILGGTQSSDETATTLPISRCPWCGTGLTHANQAVVGTKLVTKCANVGCEFRNGIPFACVDTQLYANPPSMIIGTVDKFAMMAWEPRAREFFGLGAIRRKPPSLIIQDELHLIGDALGTVTALYETAIDHLCSEAGIGPKVIGSTATIRRAGQQVLRIYNRTVEQFPPSGVDHDDSFFYRSDTSQPGRLYVGLHAQGKSPKYTLARLMGVLLQSALKIDDLAVRDQYYTLVAYFNSLRELGGAIVLAQDDTRRYIASMTGVTGPRRTLGQIQELTSYLPSQDIPKVLALMARGLMDDDDTAQPIDLVLSTNMISVGVDIDRLGLMVINGQPKTTAEYIQASSRVGRPSGFAGLVVTLYNWTRPRDRSHYERFRTYHQSFYRFVEATSVTPFSARARD